MTKLSLVACSALVLGVSIVGCAAEEEQAEKKLGTCVDDSAENSDLMSAAPSGELAAVPTAAICVTKGAVEPVNSACAMKVHASGIRGTIAGVTSERAELAFIYRGMSDNLTPLASGEVRQQIGLKLRAHDPCNVVYAMWHIAPTPKVVVSVKSNPGQATSAECGVAGYLTIQPESGSPVYEIKPGSSQTFEASFETDVLTVKVNGNVAWKGKLPASAFDFDGPPGIRSDNVAFDFKLRTPKSERSESTVCPVGISD